MVSKVLKVFYGADYLPYKDSERTIHFPVGGNTFAGTQNTFRICFYPRDLVGSNDLVEQTSWVLVSKLPNGKLGYQLLNAINTDSDLGEKYLVFDLSSYYSQYKGVVKLAIRGYQGEISFVEDEDTGVYSVQGIPIIGVTGTIDIAINYSPMVYGEELLPSELDQLVAMFSEYLTLNAYQEDWLKRIIVIDSDLVDYSEYDDGQLFYRKDLHRVMQLSGGSLIDYDFGYIANGTYDSSKTLEELATMYGLGKTFVLNYTNSNKLICSIVDLGITNQLTYNIFNPYGGVCWQDTVIKTTTLGTIVSGTPTRTFTTKSYVDNAIQDFLQNEYSKVDTNEYPTLDDFLASEGEQGYIYLYPINTSDPTQGYYQYIWEDNEWVSLGTTQIDLSGYVEKTSSANKVYGTNDQGAQTTYTVDDFYEGNIARRDTDGSITVPLTPTQNGHAASKKYVDDLTILKTLNGVDLHGSGNYTFDSALDESSTNAVQNLVIAKDLREINYELAVIRESLFETILTELPYKVNYATEYLIPSTLSDDDGTHRVVYSETQLDYFEGNGIVMNQKISYIPASGSTGGIIWTNNGNGTITVNGTTTLANNSRICTVNVDLVTNHYYMFGRSSIGNLWFQMDVSPYTSFNTPKQIATSGTYSIGIRIATGTTYTNETIPFECFDLTQMFGAGNEPTTTDDIRIQWLLSLGYISYNEGEIKNTTVSGLTAHGFNICDEQFVLGTINDSNGQNQASSSELRSVNYYNVLPNKNYCFTRGTYSGTSKIYLYRKDYSYIDYYSFSNGRILTMPNDCAFVRIVIGSTTYNHDICINISSSLDGTYKPYIAPVSISFTPTELLNALNIHDTLSVVEGNVIEGEQRYNLVKTSNVGTVDLGTLSWHLYGSSYLNLFYYDVNDIKGASDNSKANMICKSLTVCTVNQVGTSGYTDRTMASNLVKRLFVNVPNITTVEGLQQELSNTYLQYELATPTTTTIATDLTFEQVTLLIQEGGTIGVNFTDVPPNVQTKFVVKKAVGE